MTKVLVYSHDTYGLGNIRRMLAICSHMVEVSPDASLLLVTGSPLIQSFRLPQRLDYIKLPCLTRIEHDTYSTKYLDLDTSVTIRLRSSFILNTVESFRPDLLLVDKKPLGIKNELKPALAHLKRNQRDARIVLVLRDIVDSASLTIQTWRSKGYYQAIERFYDRIAVLGCPEVFDVRSEYRLPKNIAQITEYCGYVSREPGRRQPAEIRRELNLKDDAPLALVTGGGGEDASPLIETYVAALPCLERLVPGLTSLVICGPEIPGAVMKKLIEATRGRQNVILRDFTDDLMAYMAAANVVVSMGGYNTVSEILTLRKRAVIVPRVRPVEEQWIRADRMQRLGLLRAIHPDAVTAENLAQSVAAELSSRQDPRATPWVDLNALGRVADMVNRLCADRVRPPASRPHVAPRSSGPLPVPVPTRPGLGAMEAK